MKILKNLVLCLLALIAIVLIIALFLPSRYHVERSIVIRAKPGAIFPWITDPKKWPEWTAWNKEKDPTLAFTYEGAEQGAGAISKWVGKKTGNGRMTFTDSNPETGTKYDLSFERGKYQSKGAITFEPEAENTMVTWVDDGELGANPIKRYFGLFMDRFIGPDFEEGLSRLKTKVEGK
jgi:hypothetical protein